MHISNGTWTRDHCFRVVENGTSTRLRQRGHSETMRYNSNMYACHYRLHLGPSDCLFFILRRSLVSRIWHDALIMNWKGFGRRRSWPNSRYFPGFAWRHWGKSLKIAFTIAVASAKIRTENLPSANLKCYRCGSLIGFCSRHLQKGAR
jgi:hypothetical protein